MIRLLALLLLSTAAAAQSPARVASLDWMTGTWVHETSRGRVTESWIGPANGAMVAANLSAFASGRSFHEFLRIADTTDGFSYYASPGGRPPEEFKLKELGDRRVVFENAAKDFPRRILYWRDGDALMARIEGMAKGEAKSEEWRFERK
jgi:hypothetical protein